ncbi:zeta toxin family protein [Microbacterium sp. HA-8]|uniref:zeta toxin family protein n=1 Tax=unclassified Microbacterium TaxID=2609290 RepID=UPI000C2C1D0E|nr:zeta toxin family protein [Microbacterium sp. BR1]
MTDPTRFQLTDADNEHIFRTRLLPLEFPGLHAASGPSAHFFGAQPGAGKSVAQAAVITELAHRDSWDAVAAIIGDDYRPYHPDYARLLAESDETAAFYTDRDTARWVERAIEHTLTVRPHVIVEGTLRRASVTIDTARRYHDAGFDTHLHVLAIHEVVSRLRIFGRYLDQLDRDGHGRYTLPAAHRVAYDALPGSVADILSADVFDTVTVHNLHGTVMHTAGPGRDDAQAILAAIDRERASDHLDTSGLLAIADAYLDRARAAGPAITPDLIALCQDIATTAYTPS